MNIRHTLSIFTLCLLSTQAFAQHVDGKPSGPLTDIDFYDDGAPDPAKVKLGKDLFFDKILSGNLNMACATCHHVLTDTGDGLSLPVGEGGQGLGVARNTGVGADEIHERVPRNAPPVFNLGAREFTVMFHDGRVQVDANQASGFLSPAGDNLPMGLDNVLAAQALFPITSATEMAGQIGENAQADAAAINNLAGPGGVWEVVAAKLQGVPNYVEQFKAVYADINVAGDITQVHAANAIAAFEAKAWRFDDSPFDRYLRGDKNALSTNAKKGGKIFYGEGNCSSCHAGKLQTDHLFHAIAMPQIGAGKGDNQAGYTDGRDDFGRERVTGDISDRFKFRTLTLRNVALTAPYGHGGAYDTLESVVRHHLDPVNALFSYNQNQAVMPSRSDLDAKDFVVMNDGARLHAIGEANELAPRAMSDEDVGYLLDFLHSLTDSAAIDIRGDIPSESPSGIPLFD